MNDLRIGDVLDTSFRVFRENLKSMLVIAALAALARTVLEIPAEWPTLSGSDLPAINSGLGGFVSTTLKTLFLMAITEGAIIWLAFTGLRGQRTTAIQCWRKTMGMAIPLFLTSIAVAFLTFLGFLACIVPGFIVFAWLALAAPAVMLEGCGTGSSIRRSRSLVEGNIGKVLLSLLVAGIIVLIIRLAAEAGLAVVLGIQPFADFLPNVTQPASVATGLLSLASQFINVLLLPLSTIPCVVLFITLRDLKEGTELEQEVDRLVDTVTKQDARSKSLSF